MVRGAWWTLAAWAAAGCGAGAGQAGPGVVEVPSGGTEPTGASDPCDWEHGGTMGLPRCPNTGDPLPERRTEDPACRDHASGATRWLAAVPGTPLAIVDAAGLRSAGQPCCAPWAHRDDRYRAVDAAGQVVGHFRVAGGAGYDVTRGFELELEPVEGMDGAGIYASSEGAWVPSDSVLWEPNEPQRAAWTDFVAEVERVATTPLPVAPRFEDDEPLPPLEQRTLFFRCPSYDAAGHDSSTPAAVAGGRVLVIARLGETGTWTLDYLDNELAQVDYGPRFAYRPLAVFDMDGDGVPEVIFHWNEGPSWGQTVLQRNDRGRWSEAAESIGGATL